MTMTARFRARLTQATAVTAAAAAMTGLLADASAQGRAQAKAVAAEVATAIVTPMTATASKRLIVGWDGKDVDGDGADDFVNPTGKDIRSADDFGYGHFGASRDGGTREHKGVDFVADAGQVVKAPISGYVTKIGTAYASSPELKFVEIRNPALNYEARVFYVDPSVSVGDAVHLGDKVGTMHTLQDKYGQGMTNHVHLELSGRSGVKFDATEVLTARYARPKRRALG
jgi:murein DD-endopeptidase MepM/ murein hydrolase activator NlpD